MPPLTVDIDEIGVELRGSSSVMSPLTVLKRQIAAAGELIDLHFDVAAHGVAPTPSACSFVELDVAAHARSHARRPARR